MTKPSYYKTTTINDSSMVIVDEVQLNKYKSIIYGGIEYEQISIALEAIYQNRNDFEKSKESYIDSNRCVLFYYVDPNYHTYQDSSINGLFWGEDAKYVVNDTVINSGMTRFDQCYNEVKMTERN